MLQKFITCAKSGGFQELGKAAVQIIQIIYGELTGTFDAVERGAYWLDVENQLPKKIWLVCPDSFESWYSNLEEMTVADALEELADVCDNDAPPAWEDLAEWLTTYNSLISTAMQSVQSITIYGYTFTNVPAWQNPNGSISVLFRWIKQAILNAEQASGMTFEMANYHPQQPSGETNYSAYDISVGVVTTAGNFSLDTLLQI